MWAAWKARTIHKQTNIPFYVLPLGDDLARDSYIDSWITYGLHQRFVIAKIAIGEKGGIDNHRQWAELTDGCYLLRTNLQGQDAATLWKTYIGLTQIEDCFRISKHDLGLRPLYHQKLDRTQAHILVCFLALVMWRTLQQWMQGCGLGSAPRKLLEEMAEIRSLDIVLPTGADNEIRLRTVSRPEEHLAILLDKLGLLLPNKPKSI